VVRFLGAGAICCQIECTRVKNVDCNDCKIDMCRPAAAEDEGGLVEWNFTDSDIYLSRVVTPSGMGSVSHRRSQL